MASKLELGDDEYDFGSHFVFAFFTHWKGLKIPEICKKQIGVSPTYR